MKSTDRLLDSLTDCVAIWLADSLLFSVGWKVDYDCSVCYRLLTARKATELVHKGKLMFSSKKLFAKVVLLICGVIVVYADAA